jgi:hypothetical protein
VSLVLVSVVVEGGDDSEESVEPTESGAGRWGNDVGISGESTGSGTSTAFPSVCGMGGLGLGMFVGGIEGASILSALENAKKRGSREQKKSVKGPEECTGREGFTVRSNSSRSSTHQVPQAYTWASMILDERDGVKGKGNKIQAFMVSRNPRRNG